MIPVLVLSLRATALVAFARLLLVLMRRRSAAQRNLVLRIAVAVAWLLPLATLVAPRIEVASPSLVRMSAASVPSSPETGASPVASGPTPLASRLGAGPGPIAPPPSRRASIPTPPREFPWALVYGLGVGLLVVRWAYGIGRLLRIRRAAAPTNDAHVWRAAIPVPATYGTTILVPEASAEWPKSRVRAAILHERAHVRRRDWLWQTLAGALVALHWFNPFVWALARLLRDTAEAAADDAVLAEGIAPSAYARELLAVAATAGPAGPSMAMARRGGVKDRVVAILADSRDRRAPTRRGGVVLAALLAASGLAVAGLAQKVATRPKASVRLADVRQIDPVPSARWSAEGLPVPTPADVAEDPGALPGHTPRGMRRFDVRFAVEGYTEKDELRIFVDGPAKVVTYGQPHRDGQPGEGREDGAMGLTIDAPEGTTHARLRVGRATGPYKVYSGAKIPFMATDEPISWPEGTFPGAKIDFTFPRALKDLDHRVFVVTKSGRVEVRSNEYEYTDDVDDVPKRVFVAVPHPTDVLGVGIETRDYKETSIDVPLRPRGTLVTPSRTDSIHTIELVRLSEGGRAWLPDGTPAKPLGTIASRYPAGPGERKLTLAFRVRGETWSKPSLMPNVGEGYATVADFNGFITISGKPDERIGIVTFNVSEKEATSPVTVVVRANPWQTHADQLLGPGSGQAHLVREKEERGNDGKVWTVYRLTLDGVAPIDPGRDLDLSLLDKDESPVVSIVDRRATKNDPSYRVFVQGGAPIRRVILQSQSVERARFEGVHLRANP